MVLRNLLATTIGVLALAAAGQVRAAMLFVSNERDNTVSVLDPAICDGSDQLGCRHEAPVAKVGSFPTGMALDLASNTLYVADQDSDTVSVLDAATCDAATRKGCARPLASIAVGKVGLAEFSTHDQPAGLRFHRTLELENQ